VVINDSLEGLICMLGSRLRRASPPLSRGLLGVSRSFPVKRFFAMVASLGSNKLRLTLPAEEITARTTALVADTKVRRVPVPSLRERRPR
jgi:hypothetical protein